MRRCSIASDVDLTLTGVPRMKLLTTLAAAGAVCLTLAPDDGAPSAEPGVAQSGEVLGTVTVPFGAVVAPALGLSRTEATSSPAAVSTTPGRREMRILHPSA